MPSKSRRGNSQNQARNAARLAQEKAKEYREYKRELEREKKAAQKARDKEYSRILKQASKTGLYFPKSSELTNWRRKRIRQLIRSSSDLLDEREYIFVPTPKNKRKSVLSRAGSLEMKTSRTGIFVPRQGHKTASIKEDKRRGEFYIERRGKTKTGINRGRRYRDIIPLASADELDRERDRLVRMARRLGPINTDKGERLVFKVEENGIEGYSHGTFTSIDLLLKYLDQYPKNVASRINFYRHIKIEKSTVAEWRQLHPLRERGRKGRRLIIKGKRND